MLLSWSKDWNAGTNKLWQDLALHLKPKTNVLARVNLYTTYFECQFVFVCETSFVAVQSIGVDHVFEYVHCVASFLAWTSVSQRKNHKQMLSICVLISGQVLVELRAFWKNTYNNVRKKNSKKYFRNRFAKYFLLIVLQLPSYVHFNKLYRFNEEIYLAIVAHINRRRFTYLKKNGSQ